MFILCIGIAISIIYYVNNKKKSFRKSLVLLTALFLMSFTIHYRTIPDLNQGFEANPLTEVHEDEFGSSPDFLSNVLDGVIDFIKRRFID